MNHLPEGRILKVYHGGKHDVFHVMLPSEIGNDHKHWHIKYRYDTKEFFGQSECWGAPDNPCPAIQQFRSET